MLAVVITEDAAISALPFFLRRRYAVRYRDRYLRSANREVFGNVSLRLRLKRMNTWGLRVTKSLNSVVHDRLFHCWALLVSGDMAVMITAVHSSRF